MSHPGVVTDVRRSTPPRFHRGTQAVRLVLLVLSAVALIVVVRSGQRLTDRQDLQAAVASGEVRAVTVLGDGLIGADSGSAEQEVIWSTGWYDRITKVRVQSPVQGAASTDPKLVPGLDAGAWLEQLNPGVVVHRGQFTYDHSVVSGWQTPSPVGPLLVVVGIGSLFVLLGPHEPWRATRWAWFWLFLSIPFVAIPLFLWLSGPGPGSRPPRPGRRGLTGGWAFLLAAVLNGN